MRPPTEAVLLRSGAEPTHESVPVPKLNVVAVNELSGRFNGGGVVRVVMQKFDSDGVEVPVDADGIGAIIWHGGRSLGSGGSAILSVTDDCRVRAVMERVCARILRSARTFNIGFLLEPI
jgi:hypothetical protein